MTKILLNPEFMNQIAKGCGHRGLYKFDKTLKDDLLFRNKLKQ